MAVKTAKLPEKQAGDETIEIVEMPITPKTEQMDRLLAVGYPDIGSVENARAILTEREKNPGMYPYETALRARAYIAAFETGAVVISTRPGWRRKPK